MALRIFRSLVGCAMPLLFACSVDINVASADVDVEGLYKVVCEICHGPDGKGSVQGKKFKVPDFTDKAWQTSVSDEEMIKRMIEGSDNEHYGEGVIPLLEIAGAEDPAGAVPAFVPKVRGFAK